MDALAKLGIEPASILFYIVNIGILLAVIAFFVTKPLLKILDERRAKISGSLAKADALTREFEEKYATVKAETESMRKSFLEEAEQLKRSLNDERKEMYQKIGADREMLMTQAKKEIEQIKQQTLAQMEQDVTRMMKQIILTIMKESLDDAAIEKSVQGSWQKFTSQYLQS